jgi:hypothetical protein
MKEPYGEGLASHTGSESCVCGRKAECEALTGAQAGGVFSREMLLNQRADAVHDGGRQQRWVRNREQGNDPESDGATRDQYAQTFIGGG